MGFFSVISPRNLSRSGRSLSLRLASASSAAAARQSSDARAKHTQSRIVTINHRRAAKRVARLGLCDTNLGSAMLNCSSDSAARIPLSSAGPGPSEAASRVVRNVMTQWVKSGERCAIFQLFPSNWDTTCPTCSHCITLHRAAISAPVAARLPSLDSGTSEGKPRNSVQRFGFRSERRPLLKKKWRRAQCSGVISAQLCLRDK